MDIKLLYCTCTYINKYKHTIYHRLSYVCSFSIHLINVEYYKAKMLLDKYLFAVKKIFGYDYK